MEVFWKPMQTFYFGLIRPSSRDEGLLFIKESMGAGEWPTRVQGFRRAELDFRSFLRLSLRLFLAGKLHGDFFQLANAQREVVALKKRKARLCLGVGSCPSGSAAGNGNAAQLHQTRLQHPRWHKTLSLWHGRRSTRTSRSQGRIIPASQWQSAIKDRLAIRSELSRVKVGRNAPLPKRRGSWARLASLSRYSLNSCPDYHSIKTMNVGYREGNSAVTDHGSSRILGILRGRGASRI